MLSRGPDDANASVIVTLRSARAASIRDGDASTRDGELHSGLWWSFVTLSHKPLRIRTFCPLSHASPPVNLLPHFVPLSYLYCATIRHPSWRAALPSPHLYRASSIAVVTRHALSLHQSASVAVSSSIAGELPMEGN
ncbi:hypothetical protein AAHE18_16G195500 [Arachis hypogaea]